MTTLGVIGLGRIGAFHTDTLSGPATASTGWSITDERPDVVAAVAAKHGAKPVDSVEELLSSGVDGVVVAAATPAHAELTLAAVERGIPTFCEKPIAATAAESARVADDHRALGRAGAGRLPAPVRRRVRRRQARRRRRFARPAAHRAQHDDGSRSAADGVHQGLRRHLPRLRGARFRRAALDHRPAGRRGVRHRQRAGRSAVHRVRRRRHRRRRGDASTAARSAWCRRPATTPAATTAGWRCTASTTPWSPAGTRARRCEMSTPPTISRRAPRTTSSWTASPRRSAPSSAAFVDVVKGGAAPACTVADAVEVAWLAEAATESLRRGVPVRSRRSRSR